MLLKYRHSVKKFDHTDYVRFFSDFNLQQIPQAEPMLKRMKESQFIRNEHRQNFVIS